MVLRRTLLVVVWLSICPVHAIAREPFADDGHRDAWVYLGLGSGGYEHNDGSGVALAAGASARQEWFLVSARYAGEGQLFDDSAADVAILAGIFVPAGPVALTMSAGLSRTWGTIDETLIDFRDAGRTWGPRSGTAYELQVLIQGFPWIGLTAFADRNGSGDFWGVAVVGRIGTLFGDK